MSLTAIQPHSASHEPCESLVKDQRFDGAVVLLVNYVRLPDLPIYTEISRRVRKFTVLVNEGVDPQLKEAPSFGELHVATQRTWTLKRTWKHQAGFSDGLDIHIPLDTHQQLAALAPDVVVSKELGFRSLSAARFAGRKGLPLVLWTNLSEHTEKGRGRLRGMLRRWLIGKAHAITANGSSGLRYLQSLGVPLEKLHVVPYAGFQAAEGDKTTERDGKSGDPSRPKRLLHVGKMIDRKGLLPWTQVLTRWCKDHLEQQVEFHFVGNGPVQEGLQSLELPSNLTFVFHGAKDYAEVRSHYAACDVFVFPTLADEWGLVVNEAMAAGLPVLGSVYAQAVLELVEEDQTGWRFEPDDDEHIYRAISNALLTPDAKLAELRDIARRRVAHLTPAYSANCLIAAVLDAAKRRAALGGRA